MNREWHHRHKLGVNAPLEKRIAWHIEHSKKCGCRPMPGWMQKKLAAAKEGRGPLGAD